MLIQNWRHSTSVDVVNLIAAILLFISPWILGYAAVPTPAWDAWILGVLIGLVSLSALSTFGPGKEWANLVMGIWVAVAPWVLAFAGVADGRAMWSHVVLGAIVAILAACDLAMARRIGPEIRA